MKHLLGCIFFCLGVTGAQAADQYEAAMRAYLAAHIAPWASDPVIIAAINAQNAAHAALTQADIAAADLTWRAEVSQSDQPTIAPVLHNPAADLLRARMTAAGGTITEVLVMDNRGLNVAVSDPTSDYWQGDEPKWSETFGKGTGAVYVSGVEFDESTQTYQGQVSVALSDPVTRQVIGAITVGLNAASLL